MTKRKLNKLEQAAIDAAAAYAVEVKEGTFSQTAYNAMDSANLAAIEAREKYNYQMGK